MAALTGITAVRPTVTTRSSQALLGATISVGQTLYTDSADAKRKLCDANSTAAIGALTGLAMTPGIDAGYGLVATSGSVILVGTTMAVGTTYFVGQTAGSIVPHGDLTTGDYVSRLGTATTTTEMLLSIEATGIVHA